MGAEGGRGNSCIYRKFFYLHICVEHVSLGAKIYILRLLKLGVFVNKLWL